MLVVRAIRDTDVEELFDLIQKSEYGLTTLKVSKEHLERRIENSVFAFQQKDGKPAGQPYVFVMVDSTNGNIVGTSAIYSKTGGFEPLYSYEIKTSIHHSVDLDIRKEIDVLHLNREHNGPTEIGSLFLSPDYWGDGHGRLLSISRFLFMAEFPERFEDTTIAEMRGVVNQDGHSPLWDALGSHFFDINFPRAETLTAESKRFIADLMPEHPIYIPLLPESAQSVIGRVHKNTEPALRMLTREGFHSRNFVDIFDGGPTLHCETNEIRSFKDSLSCKVDVVDSIASNQNVLVSNGRMSYRACLAPIDWDEASPGICKVGKEAADLIEVQSGDSVRWVKPRPDDTKYERESLKKKHVEDSKRSRQSD